jgi:hypothetical protein
MSNNMFLKLKTREGFNLNIYIFELDKISIL